MTNAKMTRRALLSSVLALVLCFTMLLGTTFAWFTDEAVSSGNIIKSGNLQVGLYYADGTEAIPNKSVSNWKDASENPIFSFYNEEWEKTYWEPGYVQANHIMIKNEGNLAFKYVVSIIPQGDAGILADVIDVYYFPTATQIADRSALTDDYYVGTLADLMSDSDGAARGVLIPANETPDNDFEVAGEQMVTIALKMRESAGNEYQNLTVGNEWGGFSVQILATQYVYEEDSFNNQYDLEAAFPLSVTVTDSESLVEAIANAPVGAPTTILVMENLAVDSFDDLEAPEGTDVTLGIVGTITVTASNDTLEGIQTLGAAGYPFAISGSNVTVKDSTFVGGSNTALWLSDYSDTADSVTTIDNCVIEEYYTLDENGNKVYQSFGNTSGLRAKPNGTVNITNSAINVKGAGFQVGPSTSTYSGNLNINDTYINSQGVSISTVNSANLTNVTFDYTWYDGAMYIYAGAKTNTFENCEFKKAVEFKSSNWGNKDVTVEINNCTFNGVAITAENVTEYFDFTESWFNLNGRDNLTLKVNGTTVTLTTD